MKDEYRVLGKILAHTIISYAHGMRNEMHKIKKQGSSKQKRDLIIGKVKPHIKGDLFVYHSKYVH